MTPDDASRPKLHTMTDEKLKVTSATNHSNNKNPAPQVQAKQTDTPQGAHGSVTNNKLAESSAVRKINAKGKGKGKDTAYRQVISKNNIKRHGQHKGKRGGKHESENGDKSNTKAATAKTRARVPDVR